MGVYIKGMEMPQAPLAIKGCRAYMDFRIWDDGTVEARIGPKETEYKAIHVPPHGDLIDRKAVEALALWVESTDDDKIIWTSELNEVTAVIPAEEGQ